jgi:hypothetical protein
MSDGWAACSTRVEPDLTAWAITNAPDPHAMPPVSQAEQAARDASDQALFERWRPDRARPSTPPAVAHQGGQESKPEQVAPPFPPL